MSEELSRAVGAASGLTYVFGGKQCTARPMGIRQLLEVESDALERYKRQYLETYSRNLDLLPADERTTVLQSVFAQVAGWTVANLPTRYAYEWQRLKPTIELTQWVLEQFALADPNIADTDHVKRLLGLALDSQLLSEPEYTRLSGGHRPVKMKIPYVDWWTTGCIEGMVSFIWICFRHEGVTRDQVIEELGGTVEKLSEFAREIEQLTIPKNSSSPTEQTTAKSGSKRARNR